MIIEKIDIRSFGLLTDLSLEFTDSVNVIEGQNEAGKSTIAAFIKYMLFGFDAVEREDVLSERRKRINWKTGVAEGSMIVRVKGKRYLISRSTVPAESGGRVVYKEDSSIIDMESGATAFGKVPAGEVFFGVSRELFENTAFIGQVGDTGINEGSVRESIENILFSASEKINNQRAMDRISDKMEGLLHQGGHSGAIYDLVVKQQDLEERFKQAVEDNKQLLAKEAELHSIKTARSESEDMLNKLYDLDNCYKNVTIIQAFERLHELEEECEAKNNAFNAYISENTRAGYVPADTYPAEIQAARRAVNDTYQALREAEDNYSKEKKAIGITHEIEGAIETSDAHGGEEKVLKDAAAYRGGFIKNIAFTVLTALVALAAGVVEIVATGALAGVALRIVFGIVCAAGIGGAGYFGFGIAKSKKSLDKLALDFGVNGYDDLKGKIAVIGEAREKRDGMILSTENARLAVESARADYEHAKAELTKVIVRWGDEPPTNDLNGFLDKLEARVLAYLEKKRVLLEEKNTIELTVREIRHSLADKNEIDIRAQVSPMRRKALSSVNHDEIVTGISTFRDKIAEQDKLIFAVENELTVLKAKVADPAEIYARIVGLETKIKDLRQRHKAYFMAHKAIESASDNLRARISPRLGEYATKLMGIMTDKKYNSFDITNGLVVTYTAEGGEQRSVDFLSGGTRDLAYIAVRMALIDILYTEKPPVLFDESFAHQDNVRARSMMKAVAELADEGHQSFIFTCRAREGALASEMIKSTGVYKLSVSDDDIA